jgi:hypothetical protein
MEKQGKIHEENLDIMRTDLGRCLIGSLDDVSEALAIGEGEDFQ